VLRCGQSRSVMLHAAAGKATCPWFLELDSPLEWLQSWVAGEREVEPNRALLANPGTNCRCFVRPSAGVMRIVREKMKIGVFKHKLDKAERYLEFNVHEVHGGKKERR